MPDIRTVAVIGAGAMGRGIAQLAVLAGYQTILEDLLPSSLRRAQEEFRNILDQAIAQGEISCDDAAGAVARLQYAGSVEEAARQADLVIEAVPDEWESKSEIFILLDKIAKPETILVSNARVLSVSEIASVTYRPEKVVGMRFENPVHSMKRIEIVPGHETDEAALAACRDLAQRMCRKARVIPKGASGDMGRTLREGSKGRKRNDRLQPRRKTREHQNQSSRKSFPTNRTGMMNPRRPPLVRQGPISGGG